MRLHAAFLFFTAIFLSISANNSYARESLPTSPLSADPRVTLITPATRNVKEAFCYISTKKKIERAGNDKILNLDSVKTYGVVYVSILIRSDGSLDEVSILQSSGSLKLDVAAKLIVASAAPFSGCASRTAVSPTPAWLINYRASFEQESVTVD